MGTIGAPDITEKIKTPLGMMIRITLNVARRVTYEPRLKNPKAFSNKVLRKLEEIAGSN
jgi:hypothetical protein